MLSTKKVWSSEWLQNHPKLQFAINGVNAELCRFRTLVEKWVQKHSRSNFWVIIGRNKNMWKFFDPQEQFENRSPKKLHYIHGDVASYLQVATAKLNSTII